MDTLYWLIGVLTYGAIALVALWGAFCLILVWRRVAQTRFRSPDAQEEFLDELDSHLARRDFEGAAALCEDDRRALPQLALYAIENRDLGPARVQKRLIERFQQDVLADIEHRLSWVGTVIKSAPMLGLFGTVTGMMAAFGNLSKGGSVNQTKMAEDIMFALITTALGLAIAMPLIIGLASINVRLRKMEDSVAAGMSRMLETFRAVLSRS
ncbi:MAG: MotA/TolQ/ExbB proton channel family protein [Pirellulales bacterium]